MGSIGSKGPVQRGRRQSFGRFVQFDTEAFGEAMPDTRMKLEEAAFFIQGVRSVSGSEFSPRNLTDSVEPNP